MRYKQLMTGISHSAGAGSLPEYLVAMVRRLPPHPASAHRRGSAALRQNGYSVSPVLQLAGLSDAGSSWPCYGIATAILGGPSVGLLLAASTGPPHLMPPSASGTCTLPPASRPRPPWDYQHPRLR